MPKIEIAAMQKTATKLVSGSKTKLTVGVQESLDTVLELKKKLNKIAQTAALDVGEIQKGVQAAITIHEAERLFVKELNEE